MPLFFTLLLLVPPPPSFIYLCAPPFVDAVTYENNSLYFHVVDLYIRIHSYYFCLQQCIFLNILFRHNTLFTCTSKNIPLMIGIIFSVFLGPYEHLQIFECPVAVWSVISQVYLSSQHQGGYVLLTNK
jgi:hypothetical protein